MRKNVIIALTVASVLGSGGVAMAANTQAIERSVSASQGALTHANGPNAADASGTPEDTATETVDTHVDEQSTATPATPATPGVAGAPVGRSGKTGAPGRVGVNPGAPVAAVSADSSTSSELIPTPAAPPAVKTPKRSSVNLPTPTMTGLPEDSDSSDDANPTVGGANTGGTTGSAAGSTTVNNTGSNTRPGSKPSDD